MGMILVVDDDAMTLKLVEHTLTGGGHDVIATANSQEAALLAAAHQADAVILDVMMPGHSGFEVLKDLHANPDTKRLPVLMLSALGEAEDRVKGLRGGADEYIGKPFDPEELLLRLNRLIDGSVSDRAEFQGRLETLSFAEVVQSLLHSETNGVLEVGSQDQRGTLTVIGGRPTEATWGRLQGAEAVLAMMDVKSGTFRFNGQDNSPESGLKGSEIPIQTVIFTAAWLVDELSRWPDVGENAPLSIRPAVDQPPSTASEWASMPVDDVFFLVRDNPGVSIRELIEMERWAPQKLSLVIRHLVHGGFIAIDPKGQGGESDDDDLVTCGSAVEAVIRSAERQGFSPELPHVLILVDPAVYGHFLEVRQALPPENLAASGESITAAWRGGRVATLALRGPGAGLVLHIVSLKSRDALKQVRARMADYPAVMVWVGDPERFAELAWVFEWVETAPTAQWGVLTTVGEETAAKAEEILSRKERWRIHSDGFRDMEHLLNVMAEV